MKKSAEIKKNLNFKFIKFLFLSIILISSSICNIYNNAKAKQDSEIKEIGVEYFQKNINDDYILGEGDGLNIIVSRDLPQFNGKYVIDPLGKINLPRLKRI